MKVRCITESGRVTFLEEHITHNTAFMKKYGIRVESPIMYKPSFNEETASEEEVRSKTTSFDAHLDEQYGERGTQEREKFEAEADNYKKELLSNEEPLELKEGESIIQDTPTIPKVKANNTPKNKPKPKGRKKSE